MPSFLILTVSFLSILTAGASELFCRTSADLFLADADKDARLYVSASVHQPGVLENVRFELKQASEFGEPYLGGTSFLRVLPGTDDEDFYETFADRRYSFTLILPRNLVLGYGRLDSWSAGVGVRTTDSVEGFSSHYELRCHLR